MLSDPIDSHLVLRDLLRDACKRHKNAPALISQGSKMTYQEIRKRVLQLASYLQNQAGVQKGDRVALFLPNTMQFIIGCLATLEIGGVVVNINPLYTPRELSHVLKDSTPKVMIFLENFHEHVHEVDPTILPETLIATEVGDCFPWLKKIAIRSYLYITKAFKPISADLKRRITWWSECQNTSAAKITECELSSDDLAFLQYTGGTTGTPKGAMLTHGNLASNILQASSWIKKFYPHPESFRIATALPLYHIFSLTANFLTFFYLGAENLLIINPRDFKMFLGQWRTYPIDAICGVNTLFAALLKSSDFHALDKSRLKLILGGGMAVSPTLAQQWQERTGTTIIQAYGLTEASPAVTINPLNLKHFSNSIGQPLWRTEVQFIDEKGHPLPQGEAGELCVRGPQVMKGYWNNLDETKKVLLDDGWLATGDIGYQDSAGFVYLIDRKKELIIISGFNVYPSEIEEVLLKHQDIDEAAVIGEKDQQGNEHIVVFYSIKKGHMDPGGLMLEEYCRQFLTGYKIPKKYLLIQTLPKSAVGKILKRDLKKLLPPITNI